MSKGDFTKLCFIIIIIVAGCTLTTAASAPVYDYDKHDELDEASSLFNGPIEVVATHPEMVWPEGPLYSKSGNYVLFSDNQVRGKI